jgi:HEAT repeat protein
MHPDDGPIRDLVQGLDNLCENLRIQRELLLIGQPAVPVLAGFLQGPPRQFPEGRVLAAEALAHIGGERPFQALLIALTSRRLEKLNPVLRLAEETVLNAVARELGRLTDRRAIPALLQAFQSHHLLDAAAALLTFRVTAALPYFVNALEDPFKRARLSEIILSFGSVATPFLLNSLRWRRFYGEEELLPSVERRAEALKILGRLRARESLPAIRAALQDSYSKVRLEAALAFAALKTADELLEAVPILVSGLTQPDFLECDRCAEALVIAGPGCVPLLSEALGRNSIVVGNDAIPLSLNARAAALRVLDSLRGHVASC